MVLGAAITAAASARSGSAAQRVSIQQKGKSFILRSPTSTIRADRGAFAACCWGSRYVVRAGRRLEVTNPRLTFTGVNGTLNLQTRIEWVGISDGWGVFAGTWKVLRGSEAYAGLSGEGRVSGVMTASGYVRAHFFGFLMPK
jgi:hypothetical protein